MGNLTNGQIKALAPYADRLERALAGQSILLSAPDARNLENIYLSVFGKKVSLRSCCGSGRSTAQRLTPLAKLYIEATTPKATAPTPKPVAVIEQTGTQVIEPIAPEPVSTAAVDVLSDVVATPAKKRGRPAKVVATEPAE